MDPTDGKTVLRYRKNSNSVPKFRTFLPTLCELLVHRIEVSSFEIDLIPVLKEK
jgi:hypothetical protein